jgi:hypothetical protein
MLGLSGKKQCAGFIHDNAGSIYSHFVLLCYYTIAATIDLPRATRLRTNLGRHDMIDLKDETPRIFTRVVGNGELWYTGCLSEIISAIAAIELLFLIANAK